MTRTRTRLSRKPKTWHYSWDPDNRLTAVQTPDGSQWRYSYDALGRRTGKEHLSAAGESLERTRFAWDGFLLAEQAVSGPDPHDAEEITTWEYAPDSFTPVTQRSFKALRDAPQEDIDLRFYSIVADLAGAPSALVSDDGALAGYQQHTLWGGTIWHTEGASTPLRFPGQYADNEAGLHYNNQRHYDPVTGAYLSPDPLGLGASPNPHAYMANPHVETDPLGLTSCESGTPRLYHYTDEQGLKGILESKQLWKSTGPVHARYGDGQYLTDISPEQIGARKVADLTPEQQAAGQISRGQLAQRLYGRAMQWSMNRTSRFVEVDTSGLDVQFKRPGVWLIPNDSTLDITGRIVRTGTTPF